MTGIFSILVVIGVSSYTITVTETVSGNKHTEETAIIETEDGGFSFNRAIGDTVTVEDGFKMGDLYCFRGFKTNGWLTICKIEDGQLYGLSLTPEGFLFNFSSKGNKQLEIDDIDISGIYTATNGENPVDVYESTFNIFPGEYDWWVEQDFDGDENPEIVGFGLVVDGVLVVASEPVDGIDSWFLTAYEFDETGNAEGWWLTRTIIDSSGFTEEGTGWENLEFIQGFDH
jgi:hypothetical protein